MNKLFQVVLAVSLSFNVMFVLGYLTAGQPAVAAQEQAITSQQAGNLVADKLHLDSNQKEQFVRLREETAARLRELRELIGQYEAVLWSEMAGPGRDWQRIASIRGELEELRRDQRELRWQQYQKFLALLTDEQRRIVEEKMRRQAGPGVGRPDLRERFDSDGDGRLSDAERARAVQAMRERARRFRERTAGPSPATAPAPRWERWLDRSGRPGPGRPAPDAPSGSDPAGTDP